MQNSSGDRARCVTQLTLGEKSNNRFHDFFASLDGSNCHGVSGDAGAKSRVSLQAPSSINPAKALRRNLAGGMQWAPDRRRDHRLRLRTNLVENLANVLMQQAVPRHERCEVIARAG